MGRHTQTKNKVYYLKHGKTWSWKVSNRCRKSVPIYKLSSDKYLSFIISPVDLWNELKKTSICFLYKLKPRLQTHTKPTKNVRRVDFLLTKSFQRLIDSCLEIYHVMLRKILTVITISHWSSKSRHATRKEHFMLVENGYIFSVLLNLLNNTSK